jgi:hypothetical protein
LTASETPAHAQAQGGVYGAVIKNNLPFDVTFQYSFNNGPWTTVSLRKGSTMQFSVPNSWFRANPGKSVTVMVRYDTRLGDGKVTFRPRKLNMWSTDKPANGWMHSFILVNDMKDVMLHG